MKIKHVLKGAVLAACCALAQSAMADEWAFEWRGFQINNPDGSYFDANFDYKGTFTATDANHDNAITLEELTSLKIWGQDLLVCPWEGESCGVSAFSYNAASGLQFSAYYYYSYEDEWSHSIDTDAYTYDARESFTWNHSGQGSVNEWYTRDFTPQTVETVTLISSVPEPTTYAMLGAGLLLMGAVAKRRKQS
ncbi:PEP-CTERM sorting domain-containing protein [Massilia sp. METH4]|uniref:PEP-CTERM sorting domain-containing protein n=1 Tax=Massilia sp. METH4 TaxID=3123041 RepID=UPI0030D44B62